MAKLKRLGAPKFWKTSKKHVKWIVSPRPGPHKKLESIPLQVIIRDILKFAETGTEAKQIITKGEFLVDGRIEKDYAFPVGLMDVISIPRTKKYFRLVPSKDGLELMEIPETEANKKMCRINDKTVVKKGKIQLNMHDGRNILIGKDDYKTGDTVLIEVPSQKILDHLKLEKDNIGLIIKGKNSGKIAKVKEVEVKKSMRESSKIICDIEDKKVEVRKDYVFIVGKDKPMLKLGE